MDHPADDVTATVPHGRGHVVEPTLLSPGDASAHDGAAAATASRGPRLLVIGFHNVGPTWFWPYRPGAGLDGFARQVRLLQRMGTIVPLRETLDAMAAGRRVPRRPIALTFDDGYRDNLHQALPVLERLGAPATFFLVPGFLDRSVDAWWERLAWAVTRAREPIAQVGVHRLTAGDLRHPALHAFADELKGLDREGRDAAVQRLVDAFDPTGDVGMDRLFMDWDEARALAGRAAIGSHTLSHVILARESASAQRAEVEGARARLQAELAVGADLLAYPNGGRADQDAAAARAARDAGHRAAITTIDGYHGRGADPFMVRRVLLDPVDSNPVRKLLGLPGARGFLAGR